MNLFFWRKPEQIPAPEPALPPTLNQIGFMLRGLRYPDRDGRCIHQIVEKKTGIVYAETDKPVTLDEAVGLSRKFIEDYLKGDTSG